MLCAEPGAQPSWAAGRDVGPTLGGPVGSMYLEQVANDVAARGTQAVLEHGGGERGERAGATAVELHGGHLRSARAVCTEDHRDTARDIHPVGCPSPRGAPAREGLLLKKNSPGLLIPSTLGCAAQRPPHPGLPTAHLAHTGDLQVPDNPLGGGGGGSQIGLHGPPGEGLPGLQCPTETRFNPSRASLTEDNPPAPPAPPAAPSHGRSSPRPWHCWLRRPPRPAAEPGRRIASHPWRSGGRVCGRAEVTPQQGPPQRGGQAVHLALLRR